MKTYTKENAKDYTIVAKEQDMFEEHIVVIELSVNKDMEKENILDAIRLASIDYCKSKAGRQTFSHNCNNFNYADFDMDVTNEFCHKYGIHKKEKNTDGTEVLLDTTLVFEEDLV